MPSDAQARDVDVLCITEAHTEIAEQHVYHSADAIETDRAHAWDASVVEPIHTVASELIIVSHCLLV